MRKIAIFGFIACVLVVAACGGTASVATSIASQQAALVAEGAVTASGGDDTTADRSSEEAPFALSPIGLGRKVIRNAQLSLESDDTVRLFNQITALIEGGGGYIVDATIEPTEDDVPPVITATLRVPNEDLTTSLAAIEKLAVGVTSKTLSSQDVTEEFVDIEARLTNLKTLETELRKLLKEVSDNTNADPGKLLQVYTEISNVRLQIEQIEGRKQVLTNLVALATVQVNIAPVPTIVPIVEQPWRPSVVAKEALADTVAAGQRIAELGIRFGLNTLPVLLGIGGPIVLAGWFILRRYRHRTAGAIQPPTAPAV